MSEQNELQQTADAILQTGVTITVDVQARTWYERLLQKWKLQKSKRVFVVKPLVLGSLVRISKLLLSIDNSLLTKELLDEKQKFQLLNVNYDLMQKHSEAMARIMAIAVTNSKAEPSEQLVNFFLYNLTPAELRKVFGVVVMQLDVVGFTSSIISVRGLNVLEVNPKTQGS